MSYINSVYTSNLPQDATFTLSIGGYQVGNAVLFIICLWSWISNEPLKCSIVDIKLFQLVCLLVFSYLPPPPPQFSAYYHNMLLFVEDVVNLSHVCVTFKAVLC